MSRNPVIATGGGIRSRPVFRVVIVYDDFASGKRAMDTCNFLVCQLGGGIELRTSMWKFDVLRTAKLHQIAVEDAIEADVIIVANARNAGLPAEVKRWVDGWAMRKQGQAAALVALLDFTGEDVQESATVHAFLQGAAADAKIDFLPQEIRFTGSRMPNISSAFSHPAPWPAKDQVSSRMPPVEGFGIND